jgi:polyhydroxybutyrate depolymerase
MSAPRRGTLSAAILFIVLPLGVAAWQAAWYHTHYRHNRSLVSRGREREYELHVPRSYDERRPTPLVLSLHGAGLWGTGQRDASRWNEVADRHGFIVAYPSGHAGHGPRVWGPEDVPFIGELIDTLARAYHIDSTRVYVNGLSNGGGMSFVLSCTLRHRIAAVGMVGAARTEAFDWCPDKRPMPVIDFHGTADNAAAYRGGKSWVGPVFPDVESWDARWARRNGCAATPGIDTVAADVVRRTWSGCSNAADVVLYTIIGGGHTWPGGPPMVAWALGRTTTSINASELMWQFFEKHGRSPEP